MAKIHEAARYGEVLKVEICLAEGADVNEPDEFNETPLHIAVDKGHADVAEFLLDHGAKIDAVEDSGYTALQYAAMNSHVNLVEFLLKRGANIDSANIGGATALINQAILGHADMVELLLEHGADVNAANYEGATALFCAAQKGHIDVVRALLKGGAQVNQGNVLIEAAAYGAPEVVELLLKHGAQLDKADSLGTAFDHAIEGKEINIRNMAFMHGVENNIKRHTKTINLLRAYENLPEAIPRFCELTKEGDSNKERIRILFNDVINPAPGADAQTAATEKDKELAGRMLKRIDEHSALTNTELKDLVDGLGDNDDTSTDFEQRRWFAKHDVLAHDHPLNRSEFKDAIDALDESASEHETAAGKVGAICSDFTGGRNIYSFWAPDPKATTFAQNMADHMKNNPDLTPKEIRDFMETGLAVAGPAQPDGGLDFVVERCRMALGG